MPHVVLYRTAQVAVNAPDAVTYFDFNGSAVSPLAFSFASRSMLSGDTLAYYADNGAGQWERGLGTWDAANSRIARTIVRASSTGSAIAWASAPTVWSDGKQHEDDTSATEGTQSEIKMLTDTLTILLSAILEKMPRVTGTDQMAANVEALPTLANVTTVATVTTLGNANQLGGKYVCGDTLNTAGAQHIYNNIVVS